MAKSRLRIVTPSTEKRTVTPKRQRNADLRTREYLTDREVEMLAETAKTSRWGHRDATMILVAYRHGLRVGTRSISIPQPWPSGGPRKALQAYLGHKNIQHTVRYTELSPDRFKDFWR